MKKLLIVEDDITFSRILKNFLEKKDFHVTNCHTAADALTQLKNEKFDLIIADYQLPDNTGVYILQWLRESSLNARAILMTRYSDIQIAVHSMKLGALDYLIKPLNPDELLLTIEQALKQPREVGGGEKREQSNHLDKGFLKGNDHLSTVFQEQLSLVAPTDMSVIIQGESGTGKEYSARQIHLQSKRAGQPFVAIDCGSLSKELAPSELFGHKKGAFTGALMDKVGQFEEANHGTIFLDEIGNLSYEIQVQLLRAIQERKVRKVGDTGDLSIDVRVVVATNEDLKDMVKRGEFREDLYHRLNEFKIEVPPLRKRGQDIMMFAESFLRRANEELEKQVEGFAPEVKSILTSYPWPGNLREMRNIVKRAVLLTSERVIERSSLPAELHSGKESNGQSSPYDLKLSQTINEKEIILKTLQETRYNKSQTAKLLNIDRKTLYLKMAKYKIG
jgi:two-component system, NtrC family, response regulator HydG